LLDLNELEKVPFTPLHCEEADGRVLGEIQGHVVLLVFFSIP
jgi:hypothetical protein